jgi:hypothetical protein
MAMTVSQKSGARKRPDAPHPNAGYDVDGFAAGFADAINERMMDAGLSGRAKNQPCCRRP